MASASRFVQLWEDLPSPPPVAPVSRLDQLWEESLWPDYTIRRIAHATKDTPQAFRCIPLVSVRLQQPTREHAANRGNSDVADYIDPAQEERGRRVQTFVIRARDKAELESRIKQLQTRWNRNLPLFRMPKEVRDMIYDFVLLDMPQQEFIDLQLANTRHSRWKSSRLRCLLEVCRDFKDELLGRFLGLNIVRMSLHASDFSAKLPNIRRGAKVVARRHMFMAFLGRVKRFALHHEGSDRPFWKDTTVNAGLLLAQSMPQLQELTIYPTEETTHLDGDFAFFALQVLTSPSLNKLIFFDTFRVVEEGDFEWAKSNESTCRIEVACLRPDKPEPRLAPGPVRRQLERFGFQEGDFLTCHWPWRERCFSVMGIQFKTQPSLTENNRVKFVID